MITARIPPWNALIRGGWPALRKNPKPALVARGSQLAAAVAETCGDPPDRPSSTPTSHQPPSRHEALLPGPIAGRSDDGGRARRRNWSYLKISPSYVLSMVLRHSKSPQTWERWNIFRAVAANRSIRLPVVATQMLMRQKEAQARTALSEHLEANDWDRRLGMLARKGITGEQIAHWAWILSGETPDARMERFLSEDEHKPIFLLLAVLRPDESFNQRASFVAVLDYVSRHYCQTPREPSAGQPAKTRMAADPRLNMSPEGHFVKLLRLLVYHCLRMWPELLVSVARLVTAYILTIRPSGRAAMSPRKLAAAPHVGYAARCLVFNHAIQLFGQGTARNAVKNTRYNWEAQKLLLSFSTSLERQLILRESSYTAIQAVMLGLGKSQAEEKVAVRSRKTWPPYRQVWDGLDERRNPQDDLSRSVKAGILAREAGYPETDYHQALGALGGAILGQSPTVQTRSAAPTLWKGRLSSLNIFTTWAAKVKATRNAHEAWRIFETPPMDGLRPNFQVYAEMFSKLYAEPAAEPASAVPGNAREVLPPYEVNLTAVERARLQPPSVAELYDHMLKSGNRPVHHCLTILIANANSEDAAMQYLLDSPLRPVAFALRRWGPDAEPPREILDIPAKFVHAYICLLLKLHSENHPRAGYQRPSHPDAHIRRAVVLAISRFRPDTREGSTYKRPWHSILTALATKRILSSGHDRAHSQLKTLSTALDIFERARRQTGMDAVLLEQLSFAVSRTMISMFADRHRPGSGEHRAGNLPEHARQLLERGRAALAAAFDELAYSGRGRGGRPDDAAPSVPLCATHIYRYMRTLGLFDDGPEMVGLMEWVLRRCDEDDQFLGSAREVGTRDHSFMIRALAYFRGFLERRVPEDVLQGVQEDLQRLVEEKGVPWPWPEGQDIDSRDEVTRAQEIARRWSAAWGG